MVRKRVGKKYCSSYRGILVKLISVLSIRPLVLQFRGSFSKLGFSFISCNRNTTFYPIRYSYYSKPQKEIDQD